VSIKHGLRRLRYWLNWNYPGLYDIFVKVAFPAQLLVLCLLVTAVVKTYNSHYSFEAAAARQQALSQSGQNKADYRHPLSQNKLKRYFHASDPNTTYINRASEQTRNRQQETILPTAATKPAPAAPATSKARTTLVANLAKDIHTTEEQLRAQVRMAEHVLQQKKLEAELLQEKVLKAKKLLNSELLKAEPGTPPESVNSSQRLLREPEA